MEPVLAFRLEEFNISPVYIGTFFSIQPVSYSLLSFAITWFTEKYANRGLLMIGALTSGLSMFLVGPSHMLPNDLNLMGLGQLCIGATGLFMMVPSIPEMIRAASLNYPKRIIELTDMSAGVFNCCLGIGMVVAPIFGSIMTKEYDFRNCSDMVAYSLLVYFLVYFLLADGLKLLRSGCKEKSKKEVDVIREDFGRNMSIRNRVFSGQSHDDNFDLDTMKLLLNEPLVEQPEKEDDL
jgi:MFS family permease